MIRLHALTTHDNKTQQQFRLILTHRQCILTLVSVSVSKFKYFEATKRLIDSFID